MNDMYNYWYRNDTPVVSGPLVYRCSLSVSDNLLYRLTGPNQAGAVERIGLLRLLHNSLEAAFELGLQGLDE
jgi:hypothetical protein